MVEIIATACAGLFAGAAIFISAVQHPASLQVGSATSAKLFSPMYHRAAPMQGGLAVVGSLSGLLAWFSGSGVLWLVGAALLGSVVPFTLIRMKAVNDGYSLPISIPQLPRSASCFISSRSSLFNSSNGWSSVARTPNSLAFFASGKSS